MAPPELGPPREGAGYWDYLEMETSSLIEMFWVILGFVPTPETKKLVAKVSYFFVSFSVGPPT